MKTFNDLIIEGAWGYDPLQNDGVLDLKSDIITGILEYIYDECFKLIWGGSFEEGDDIPALDGNSAWEVVGIVEYMLEKTIPMNDCYRSDKDPEYEKYYYWWRLKRDKKKDIIDLYSEAIQKCASDEKFINSWSEPESMKKSLKERGNILKKYADLRDQYFQHELDIEKDRVKATIDHVKNPNSIICYGKGKNGKMTWHCEAAPGTKKAIEEVTED